MVLYPESACKIADDSKIAEMYPFTIIANLSFLTILELVVFNLYKLLKTNFRNFDLDWNSAVKVNLHLHFVLKWINF